jgi:hypothetical protein
MIFTEARKNVALDVVNRKGWFVDYHRLTSRPTSPFNGLAKFKGEYLRGRSDLSQLVDVYSCWLYHVGSGSKTGKVNTDKLGNLTAISDFGSSNLYVGQVELL